MANDRRLLANFRGDGYTKGRPIHVQAAWIAVSSLVFKKWWCPNSLRIGILRLFGASIGQRVIIRMDVTVHWPWKLTIGSDTWIGQQSWLLNLEPISIGSNVCISQGVLLCTGSHDRRSPTFEFDNKAIAVSDGAWVAARATVLRGVIIGQGATVGATALVSRDVPADSIVVANRSEILN